MVMALAGQAMAQAPQAMHSFSLCSGLPRNPAGISKGSKGYPVVASPALRISLNSFSIPYTPFPASGEWVRRRQ